KEDTGKLEGSGRNFGSSPLKDFRQELEESKLFNFAAGHDNAFGFSIDLDNAIDMVDVLNEQLAHIKYDNLTHYVDLEYVGRPDAEDIIEIAKHNHLWANGLEEPKVYVRDIKVKKSDIKFIGARETTDRKSTRLNSSHVSISYAVFCLKKKRGIGYGFVHRKLTSVT